ncbi:MAG TPA: diacylglycerol kinase family protein [Candidatus Binatia bacterium]|jgi:diacylglycerol kinase family enzyme
MKVTLIHNPDAGTDQPCGDELISLIRGAGYSVIYQSCAVADWPRVFREVTDLVAVAGGDGIVGQVAKRLVGDYVPMTILPMGTANNIATSMGLGSRPLDRLIAGWASARTVKFDVGIAKGPWGSSYFVEGVGLGVFTDTMARLDARKNIDIAHHHASEKKILSVAEIVKIRLDNSPVRRLKLALDSRDLSGDYIMLEIMNIRCIGPNLCLAPNADFGDGLLDLVLVAEDQREQMNRYLSDRTEGTDSYPALPVLQGRHLRIECEELRVHIDDDIWPEAGDHPPYSPMIIDATFHDEGLDVLLP